jgi:hypothetical protein
VPRRLPAASQGDKTTYPEVPYRLTLIGPYGALEADMRVVEKKMVTLVQQGEAGKASNNTKVLKHPHNPSIMGVTLFGKTIAHYNLAERRLLIRDAGFRTATTKSRINALLVGLFPGYHIIQEKHEWYLHTTTNKKLPWTGQVVIGQVGVVYQ